MILTVTANPAIDRVYFINGFEIGKVHRADRISCSAGGKGLNVARVAHIIGRETAAMGFVGGYTGEHRYLLLCAVRPSEVALLQSIVRKTDPSAFMVISDVGEILGEGFKKNE